jgi:AraC-like DNA-binding protein
MSALEVVPSPPPAGLEDIVTGLWFVRGPAPTPFERILPAPDVALVVPLAVQPYRVHDAGAWRTLGGTFVAGLRQEATISSNGAVLGNVGATIRADALRALGLDPVLMAGGVREVDGFGELEALGADVGAGDALRALTSALRSRRDTRWQPDPVVRSAIARFAEDPQPRVSDVAQGSGVSSPALVARFRRATGVTPKAYAHLMRLHGLLERLTAAAIASTGDAGAPALDGRGGVAWSELAVEAGYYDQSHLTRAFHRFVGLTPAAYFDGVRGRGPDAVRFVPEDEAPGA